MNLLEEIKARIDAELHLKVYVPSPVTPGQVELMNQCVHDRAVLAWHFERALKLLDDVLALPPERPQVSGEPYDETGLLRLRIQNFLGEMRDDR